MSVVLVLLVGGAGILGSREGDEPVSTIAIDGKTIKVYVPGSGYSLGVSALDDGGQKVVVRERTIAIAPDNRISVDGMPLAVDAFTVLAIVVHPDRRVEVRVLKSAP